jgi:hypothetical protein
MRALRSVRQIPAAILIFMNARYDIDECCAAYLFQLMHEGMRRTASVVQEGSLHEGQYGPILDLKYGR